LLHQALGFGGTGSYSPAYAHTPYAFVPTSVGREPVLSIMVRSACRLGTIAPRFSARRMLIEYVHRLYLGATGSQINYGYRIGVSAGR
jgi:hypothetical protein